MCGNVVVWELAARKVDDDDDDWNPVVPLANDFPGGTHLMNNESDWGPRLLNLNHPFLSSSLLSTFKYTLRIGDDSNMSTVDSILYHSIFAC